VRPPFLRAGVAAKELASAAQGLADKLQSELTTEEREPQTPMKMSVFSTMLPSPSRNRFYAEFSSSMSFSKVPVGYIPLSPLFLISSSLFASPPVRFAGFSVLLGYLPFHLCSILFSLSVISRSVYPAPPPSNPPQWLDRTLTTCYLSESQHRRCLLVPLVLR
jgi:hypothetical protein